MKHGAQVHAPVLGSQMPWPPHTVPSPVSWLTPGQALLHSGPQNLLLQTQGERVPAAVRARRTSLVLTKLASVPVQTPLVDPTTPQELVHPFSTLILQTCWDVVDVLVQLQPAREQSLPVKPQRQVQMPVPWSHTPLPLHGLSAPPGHSFEHPAPQYPGLQVHVFVVKFGVPLPVHQSMTGVLKTVGVALSETPRIAPGGARQVRGRLLGPSWYDWKNLEGTQRLVSVTEKHRPES